MTVIENAPLPPLTPELWRKERLVAATMEAQELVFAAVGAPPDGDARGAFAKGVLAAAIAKAIIAAEDRGTTPRVVPELIPVWGDLERGVVVTDPEQLPADHRTEGLQCPHCHTVAWNGGSGTVLVIDKGTRENHFEFDVDLVPEYEEYTEQQPRFPGSSDLVTVTKHRPTGRQVEARAIVGGYGGGADMHTDGYACGHCGRRVDLPEGVEEVGN